MSGRRITLYFALITVLCALSFDINIKQYLYPIEGFYALSGSFGELRSNHFHGGLDIKTGGQSGRPLRAVEEGYVYRIKISPYGYGRAIYLRHIDGNYSLYGHMSRFTDALEAYARKYQYQHKKSAVEIYPKPNEIAVKKGELIGYSGNSGSSLGPHLHFEIRDSTERILNPLSIYKNHISDTKPPIVQEIAFEPLGIQGRVKGTFNTHTFPIESVAGGYKVSGIIPVSGPVGLRYRAYDLLNAARNHCGINTAKLFLDNELIYVFDLQSFAFDETRFINVHVDYEDQIRRKRSYQRAFLDEGNNFSAVKNPDKRGIIHLLDDQIHAFRLELSDTHGNKTKVSGQLRRQPNIPVKLPFSYSGQPSISYRIERSILKLSIRNPRKNYEEGIFYENQFGDTPLWTPAYAKGNELIFLMHLDRYNIPRRVFDKEGFLNDTLPIWETVTPNKTNLVEHGNMQLLFPHESVYSESYLEVDKRRGEPEMLSDIYRIGHITIPVFRRYLFSLMPKDTSLSKYAAVAYLNKDKWIFIGSRKGDDGRVFASTNDFGEFCLMLDSIPPEVRPISFINGGTVSKNQTQLRIRVDDNFSGVNSERTYATLDGKWIPFEYDYKRDVLFHRLKERPSFGTYQLEIKVFDRVGNSSTQRYALTF